MTFPTDELREMKAKWDEDDTSHDVFLERVAERFGWTIGGAYMATGFLFRHKEGE